MLRDAAPSRVFIARGKTDLRLGIDGLVSIVRSRFQLDPYEEGTLFLFCGTRTDRINWMPKGMVASFAGGAAGAWIATLGMHILMPEGIAKRVMTGLSATAGVALSGVSGWSYLMYRAFDYNGKRQMSRQIIEGIADHVNLPEDGNCLDVGCGSGALAIAIAKRNPKAHVTGIDRWGKEYASFNKPLCENNALAEGVTNVSFMQGDATHLDFTDETFDAVASNYVYHNIPAKDR